MSEVNDLRVMMIAPTPFFSDRGCHVRIYEEIRALQTCGAKILLVTYPNGNDVDGIETLRAGRWTGYSRAEAGPHLMKPFLDALLFFKAASAARKFKPHIIHAHLHEGCLVGWPIARIMKIPLVFDYQGSFARELAHHEFVREGGLGFSIFSAIEKFINNRADVTLPSSAVFAQGLTNVRGIVAPVQDALEPLEFCGSRSGELGKELGMTGRFVVVFLGLLNAYQGVDLLMKSIIRLNELGRSDILFLIMGYPDVEKYKAIAERAGVSEMVRFTGRVAYSEAGRLLGVGDIAVAPKIAQTESNGKVLDYMACGLPTVAFDTPVNRELMADAGLLVPWEGDEEKGAEELARGIERLYLDESLRSELAQKGRERVARLFTREALANRLFEVYESILKTKGEAVAQG